jgi:hypothetical protein
MARHLVAFYSTTTSTTSYQIITPVADSLISIQNGNSVQIGALKKLAAAYAKGQAVIRARFQAPSILTKFGSYLGWADVDTGLVSAGATTLQDPPVQDWFDRPVDLDSNDNLQAAAYAQSGLNNAQVLLAWLDNGVNPPAPSGAYLPGVRFTGSTTLAANAWTDVPLTPDDAIGAGTYAVVGMRAYSATAIAARLNLKGYPYRMGVLASPSGAGTDTKVLERFRAGRLGEWGRFTNQVLPSVEFLAGAADTSEIVYLDLVKVG